MTNRLLSLIVTGVCVVGIALIVHFTKHVPELEQIEKKYQDSVAMILKNIDSVNTVIDSIVADRKADSIKNVVILKANAVEIKKLKKHINAVDFKNFNDPQLDSVLDVLYPRAQH